MRLLPFAILLVSCLPLTLLAAPLITFNVHSNTPPFEWRNQQGDETGFNIELAKYIAHELHYDINIERNSLQQSLNNVEQHRWQLSVIALPASQPVDKSTAFPLLPTFASAYNRLGGVDINDWRALSGKRVAVKQGSAVALFLSQHPQPITVVPVISNEVGFQLVNSGEVDVSVAEFYCARRLLLEFPEIKTAGKPLVASQFYLISSNKDADFASAVKTVIQRSYRDGYFDGLLNHWVSFGKEKIELGRIRNDFFIGAIVTAVVSLVGLMVTLLISWKLKQNSGSLTRELRQRRLAEAEIKRVSAQFHSVLAGLPHGVLLVNRQCHPIWANDKTPWLTNPAVLATATPALTLTELVDLAINDKSSEHCEFELQQQRWRLQMHLIADDMVAIFVEDISKQHQLKQANELASRLASLGELSAGIAHEINNPVGLIRQSVSLMRDLVDELHAAKKQPDIQQSLSSTLTELDYHCESVEDGASRIANIVRDLKQFATPNSRTLLRPINLNQVVQTSLRLTNNIVKKTQLQLVLDEQLPPIDGDELQLQLVLVNFIQNACLAMDKAQPRLMVRTSIDNGAVILSIADNGCGMSQSVLSRIREPFFTTRRQEGGTGLGLSTSNKILNEHRAQWQIHSRLGVGTEMKVIFKQVA